MQSTTSPADQLADLGTRIWAWRTEHQPRSRDDIPRLDRPSGWLPDHRAETFAAVRAQREDFQTELAALDPGPEIADQVDHRLLRSALGRVHWELDVLARWQRQPRFYIDQALGTVFDALLPPNVDAARVREVIRLLGSAPEILRHGAVNLDGTAVAEFADLAIGELADLPDRCARLASALAAIAPELTAEIDTACAAAGSALAAFRETLVAARSRMPAWSPVGAEQYAWFLREVAVLPYGVDELRLIGKLELDRAMTLEHLELNKVRIGGTQRPPLPADATEQAERESALESEVRQFYVEQGLLSQPADLGHYWTAPQPDYLEPLQFLGVDDDLTSPDRLDQNGVSYVPPPSPELPYFNAANAVDPRAGIVHEGAHYQQLAMSWRHPRELRRPDFYELVVERHRKHATIRASVSAGSSVLIRRGVSSGALHRRDEGRSCKQTTCDESAIACWLLRLRCAVRSTSRRIWLPMQFPVPTRLPLGSSSGGPTRICACPS